MFDGKRRDGLSREPRAGGRRRYKMGLKRIRQERLGRLRVNSQGGNTGSTPVCATMICGHFVAMFVEIDPPEAFLSASLRYDSPAFEVIRALSKSSRAEIN